MIEFGPFLEHARARFRTWGRVPDLDKSRIFHLGDDTEFHKGVKEISMDLLDDCRAGIPTPFKDYSMVSIVRNLDVSTSEGPPATGEPCWTIDRVIVDPPDWKSFVFRDEAENLSRKVYGTSGKMYPVEPSEWPVLQRLLICRYQYIDHLRRFPEPMVWGVYFRGVIEDGLLMDTVYDERYEALVSGSVNGPSYWFLYESGMILNQTTAISHPLNYTVRVTPKLTPREQRRQAAGKEVGKRPHFIVVDHEILTRMRSPEPTGHHASPVPHERRAHWRRLSERCRLAHLAGKKRVFVRQSLIGEPVWSDSRNEYAVILPTKPIAGGLPATQVVKENAI